MVPDPMKVFLKSVARFVVPQDGQALHDDGTDRFVVLKFKKQILKFMLG
jgi:hypothetical protein